LKEVAKKVDLKQHIDADTVPVERDHYFRNAYVIDLPLNSVPDHTWQDIFDREWKSSMHLWDRKLFVVADHLRLITTIDDIGSKLDWVNQVIERTNEGIDEYNKTTAAEESLTEEESHRKAYEERMNIDAIRDSLRKRFG
jgi:tRNA uridine 5-carbamoylmethylation protein Kti12